ncbi:MAG TPA: UDP-N-acetylmuramate--L-alanine ligase [Peptococcaceae bacterium]|nr:UDP-N-acetylmuramate--L-alanine ligase [Peptococcaceae bacterium]
MPGQWYHFVGIGGAGMSALAKILLAQGYRVSGSDLADSKILQRLRNEGAEVFIGHAPENLQEGVGVVVFSSAVPPSNVELKEAQKKGLPVISRGELLAQIMKQYKGIAVVGAHGKTTTSSMISFVLYRNGFDPTIIIGGEVNDIGGNAALGSGEYLVAEADESDGSFLHLEPYIAVITNIDNDHLDYYRTIEEIEKAFRTFIEGVRPDGFVVMCGDDPRLRSINPQGVEVITYGFHEDVDFRAELIFQEGLRTEAVVTYRDHPLGRLRLSVPGAHNIQNALAAVAVGIRLGLHFPEIARALADFRGVQRRFQEIACLNGIKIIDDYAHHPTEIKALLEVAQALRPSRLIVVFQPHRYTRTLFLQEQFGTAFQRADLVIVTDIYPAGEKPIPGVSAELITREIKKNGQPVIYLHQMQEIVEFLAEECRPGDLVLTVGAGDIWRVGKNLAENLKNPYSCVEKVPWTGKN